MEARAFIVEALIKVVYGPIRAKQSKVRVCFMVMKVIMVVNFMKSLAMGCLLLLVVDRVITKFSVIAFKTSVSLLNLRH